MALAKFKDKETSMNKQLVMLLIHISSQQYLNTQMVTKIH